MNRKTAGIATTTALVVSLALTACGGGGSSTVTGTFDEVKSAKAVSEKSHYVTKPKTKRVCVSRNKKGRCTSYADRPNGTKRVKVIDRASKSAIYCVELDHVKDGKQYRDDVTFEVSYGTYLKYRGKDEGDKVKKLSYTREVSRCKR